MSYASLSAQWWVRVWEHADQWQDEAITNMGTPTHADQHTMLTTNVDHNSDDNNARDDIMVTKISNKSDTYMLLACAIAVKCHIGSHKSHFMLWALNPFVKLLSLVT